MKILYVVTGLSGGGAEKLLCGVCRILRQKHDVSVIFLTGLYTYEDELKSMGVATIFLDYDKYGLLGCILKLRKMIRIGNYNIVHTHLPMADTIGRMAGLLVPKTQIISTIHNTDQWKASRCLKYSMLKLFNRFTVNCFKRVRLIAVSNIVKEYIIKHERLKRKKITVINNFIDFHNVQDNDFHFDIDIDNKFVITTIGRLEKTKGHPLLFNAIDQLCNNKNYKNILLIVLGTGELYDELKQFTKQNDLLDHIIFMGFRKNVFHYLRLSDLFVLASEIEGQSLAILEAFYCNTVALCSDIAANTEVLHDGEYGICFKNKDVLDLIDKIEDVMCNKYNFDEIRKKAHAYSLTFTAENHMKQLMELYRKSIELKD